MQNEDSWKYPCPKCEAAVGSPCVTLDGREAEKVHYGRPNRPTDRRMAAARERVRKTMATSKLRPTPASPGIWIGSEFVSRNESLPYGVWVCSCGEFREARSLLEVTEMNLRYAEHEQCRQA